MAMPPIVAKLLLSAEPEKVKKAVIYTVAAIIGIIVVLFLYFGSILLGMVYIINPQIMGDVSNNIHYQAIQSVKAGKNITNDFDLSYLIMIDLLHDHNLMRRTGPIESFLETYFVIEHEEIIEHEPEEEGGEPVTETRIYYLFAEGSEIMQTILSPPFAFTDSDLEAIRNMIYSGTPPIEDIPTGELEFNGTYPMPLRGRITSGYGHRTHPIMLTDDFHTGIDIVGQWHANIISIADGTVAQVSSDQWYGNYILIRHKEENREFYSFYAHLYSQNVRVGQTVRQGQVIAREGGEPGKDPNVGLSTGHHLHFGIYANPNRNSHLDPIDFLYDK